MCSSCVDATGAVPPGRRRRSLIAPAIVVAAGIAAGVVALLSLGGGKVAASPPAQHLRSLPVLDQAAADRAAGLERGHVLVELWSSGCPACGRQARLVESFVRRHRGVRTVAVDVQGSAAEAAATARGYGWSASVLLDRRGRLARELRLRSLPATLLVDDGRILTALTGATTDATLTRAYAAASR
jgi:thiol-disulfide isomerase/thioredoxin